MTEAISWKERAERMAASLKRAREATREAAAQFETDVFTIGAGVGAGAARGYFVGKGKTYSIGKTAKVSPEVVLAIPLKGFAYASGTARGAAAMHGAGNGILSFIGGLRAMEHMQKKEQTSSNANGSSTGGPRSTARADALRETLASRKAA